MLSRLLEVLLSSLLMWLEMSLVHLSLRRWVLDILRSSCRHRKVHAATVTTSAVEAGVW